MALFKVTLERRPEPREMEVVAVDLEDAGRHALMNALPGYRVRHISEIGGQRRGWSPSDETQAEWSAPPSVK